MKFSCDFSRPAPLGCASEEIRRFWVLFDMSALVMDGGYLQVREPHALTPATRDSTSQASLNQGWTVSPSHTNLFIYFPVIRFFKVFI